MLPVALIVHELPGRVRLRIRERKGDREYFQRVAAEFIAVEGVEAVVTDFRTGSVLVRYRGELPSLLEEGAQRDLFRIAKGPQGVAWTTAIYQALERGDRELYAESGGRVDFSTLSFLAMAAAGIFQVANGRGLPAGVTLLRYAYEVLRNEAARARAAAPPADST